MSNLLNEFSNLPATRLLIQSVIEQYPSHVDYLLKSFRGRSSRTTQLSEQTASLLEKLEDGRMDRLVLGYGWICEMVRVEELEFRRTGSYRHTSFEEVDKVVYQRREDMSKYMDGLLATEVLWVQHARSMDFFVNTFLPKLPQNYNHLEIGPGHGILLYYASIDSNCAEVSAWDISPASLELTNNCLRKLGVSKNFKLEARNVMAAQDPVENLYDSIVISEVLEHLEDPLQALKNLRQIISSRGHIYVNVPVNAPAVDHIHLLRSPEDAVALVERAGFVVDEMLFAPMAGYNLARTRKVDGSISVALAARPF